MSPATRYFAMGFLWGMAFMGSVMALTLILEPR